MPVAAWVNLRVLGEGEGGGGGGVYVRTLGLERDGAV